MRSIIILIALTNLFYAKGWGLFGLVENGENSFNTFNQRVFEWEYYKGGCYCIHAAGATAINIRLGKKLVDTRRVYLYFKNELNGYNKKDICNTSLQDWLNASNKYHIPDLQISKEPKKSNFSNIDVMWNNIKKNIDNDRPMIIVINKYSPKTKSFLNGIFQEVIEYKKIYGHALVIVGYIVLENHKYLIVRDPSLSDEMIKSYWKNVGDYVISLEILEKYLQKKQILVFNTKKNADLKSMKIMPGDKCSERLLYDCDLKCQDIEIISAYLGDGFCDDGKYDINLNCSRYEFDKKDCD